MVYSSSSGALTISRDRRSHISRAVEARPTPDWVRPSCGPGRAPPGGKGRGETGGFPENSRRGRKKKAGPGQVSVSVRTTAVAARIRRNRDSSKLESVITYEGLHDIHTLVLGEHLTGIPAYH